MTDHVTAHDPPAKNRVNEATVRQGIALLLDTLTFRERKVLEMRYGLGGAPAATLEVIGEHIGLSRERVRQIEVEALRKLQLHPNARTLEKRA